MERAYLAYYALFLVGMVVLAIVGAIAWRRRDAPGARPLALLSAVNVCWLGAGIGDWLSSTYDGTLFWWTVLYLPVVLNAAIVLVLVLEYTGREHLVTRRMVALLLVVPTVTFALVLTNSAHELIWASIEPSTEVPSGYEAVHGDWFWVHATYSYGLLALASGLLVRSLYRSRDIYRGQAIAVLIALFAPWLGNAVYIFEFSRLDFTPIGFTVTALAFGVAIVKYRFTDVVPVARATVVDNITDAVYVLDDEDRVVDVNPRGKRLLDREDESIVGDRVDELFPARLVERFADVVQGSDELAVETNHGVRHFAIEVTPLSTRADDAVGRLVLVRDVTERNRRERELERQNEQLEQFAGLVSHDLRNPLNVAQGYLEVLRARSDDPAVDEVDRSLARMEGIIEDVLTLTRQGRTITEREPVDLAALVRDAWDNVETREASLSVDLDGEVEAAPSRLKQAFENLFRNAVEHGSTSPRSRDREDAVEHGGDGVRVEVGAIEPAPDGGETGRDEVGFYVADDGPGVPPSDRESILESGYTTSEDGTGLGLAIVRSIVEAHGWTLSVTESDRGGARFEVRYERATTDGGDPAAEQRSTVVE